MAVKIDVQEQTLSIELINKVKEFVRTLSNCRANYTSWKPNVIKNSVPVLIFDFEQSLEDEIKTEVLKKFKQINSEDKFIICYHYWPPNSFIPWHEDIGYSHAITIYLNEVWDVDWGGYFAYEEGNEIKCIKPSFNLGVCIEPPLRHSVFLINSMACVRETIQIFLKQKNEH